MPEIEFDIIWGGAYFSREFLDFIGCSNDEDGYYFHGKYVSKTWEEYIEFTADLPEGS